MKQNYVKKQIFNPRMWLMIALVAGMTNIGLAQETYNGNGQGGFGGPVGGSEMIWTDDGTTINVTFTKGPGGFNDAFVIYISTGTEGRSSIGTEVNDRGDPLRSAISYMEAGTGESLTFPAGFEATHAIAINTDFGGLWSIPPTGDIGDDELAFVTAVNSTLDDPDDATFTFEFDLSDIGLDPGDQLKFVATYLNPFGGDGGLGFASNEGYGGGFPDDNIGQNSFTFTSYLQYPQTLEIGWANLQWPPSGEIHPEQEFIVYSRVWIGGLTGDDATEDDLEALDAWIGYSTTDAGEVSDFEEGWTWVESDLNTGFVNDEGESNSEFETDIGSQISDPDTYYYVSRFQFEDGDYVYGGFQDGPWDGINNVSGVLTVSEIASATLDPIAADFDLGDPGDVSTTITWNDATSVEEITEDGDALTEDVDFSITGNGETATLTIFESYFDGADADDVFDFTISFDLGTDATFTVTILPLTFSLSFEVDMTDAVAKDLFDHDVDNVDVAGSFNNWGDPAQNLERVGDTDIYAFTTGDIFEEGEEIEFKFRINADWDNSQPADNIVYTVTDDENQVYEYFWVTPEIGFANLQWPPEATITIGDADSEETIYAQVWIDGVTGTGDETDAISVWLGINEDNTDPATWDDAGQWLDMAFANEVGNNDEYSLQITGADFAGFDPGTYYYATRFQYGEDDQVYGGFEGGFWDGTDNVSGVLTLEEPPAPEFVISDVPDDGILGLDYIEGEGPSEPGSFTMEGEHFDLETVIVDAPENFEVRTNFIAREEIWSDWTDELILENYDGDAVTIQVRLKADLEAGDYDGDILIALGMDDVTLPGSLSRSEATVFVQGSVQTPLPVSLAPWALLVSLGLIISFLAVRVLRIV